MHCCDTDSQPAIRLEHLNVRATKRLNKLIGVLKAGFGGNGQLTLIFSGGKMDKIELLSKETFNEKE